MMHTQQLKLATVSLSQASYWRISQHPVSQNVVNVGTMHSFFFSALDAKG